MTRQLPDSAADLLGAGYAAAELVKGIDRTLGLVNDPNTRAGLLNAKVDAEALVRCVEDTLTAHLRTL